MAAMQNTDPFVLKMVRISALLWGIYLFVVALMDFLWLPGNAFSVMLHLYYGPNLLYVSCFCLVAFWHWRAQKLIGTLLPLMVILALVFPMLTNAFITPLLPLGPTLTVEGLAVRTIPVVSITLILIMWQYPWQYVIWLVLGTTALRGGYLFIKPGVGSPQFYPALLIVLAYPISFLAIGFVISRLIKQLRSQQQSLHNANNQLRHYASTLEQLAISRERNRIARELHDTLAHTLSGLSVQLESVKAYWEVDSAVALSMLERSLEATRSGLEETRRVLKAVRASPLEDLGLGLAITQTAQEAAKRGNLSLDLAIPDPVQPLSPDIEQCVYRVAQEAITNVLYHANATCLQVHLQQGDEHITLRVKDDGHGFDPKSKKKSGHFGLTGMHERARVMGGSLMVESQSGSGTVVTLTI
jgi:signal transduction histidine kinase